MQPIQPRRPTKLRSTLRRLHRRKQTRQRNNNTLPTMSNNRERHRPHRHTSPTFKRTPQPSLTRTKLKRSTSSSLHDPRPLKEPRTRITSNRPTNKPQTTQQPSKPQTRFRERQRHTHNNRRAQPKKGTTQQLPQHSPRRNTPIQQRTNSRRQTTTRHRHSNQQDTPLTKTQAKRLRTLNTKEYISIQLRERTSQRQQPRRTRNLKLHRKEQRSQTLRKPTLRNSQYPTQQYHRTRPLTTPNSQLTATQRRTQHNLPTQIQPPTQEKTRRTHR